ncbi:MAG: alpha/beta hydrolase [Clostridiales bacterium]|nr:alpha/beta hydrolase [Clostridiales bacterium]
MITITNQPKKHNSSKLFYFVTALIYLPLFYSLAVIDAKWYGYVLLALSFGLLLWVIHHIVWRGWQIPLCYLCAMATAFVSVYTSRPRLDVSLIGQVMSGSVRFFVNLPVDQDLLTGDAFTQRSVWTLPEGYTSETITLPDSTMELLTKDDSTSDYIFLQLHGGAFISGVNDLYRVMAKRFSDLSGGAAVCTLDYRLSPAYPYPAQQIDTQDAWQYITETLGYPADHVILTGDSAGGNLVLSHALRLRDAGEPLPAALIAFSPWADLSNSGESHITNATSDPTFGILPEQFDGVTPVGVPTTYIDDLDPTDRYISPSYGDFEGFPPMLLQVAEIEVLRSDSELIYQNAISHGVDCTLSIYSGMFHVFQGSLDLLPESRQAWAEVTEFVRGLGRLSNQVQQA